MPTSSKEAGGVGGGGCGDEEKMEEEEEEGEERKRGMEEGAVTGLWIPEMSSSERMLWMTLSFRPLPLRA